MNFSKLCTPAYIYFIISIIYLVFSSFTNLNIVSIVVKLFFIILWSWLLNFLCTKGFSLISWLAIILPFIGFIGSDLYIAKK